MASFLPRWLRRARGGRSLARLSASIEAVVARVAPSVVGLDSPLRPLGSGTVLSAAGLVVTAAHVVEGERAIVATLADGRRFEATRVAGPRGSGLAFLSISARGLLPAALDAAACPRLGAVVIAIGRPPGEGPCAALGVVAGLPRRPGSPFATDVRVHMGAAGGPLVGAQGRVVAIASVAVAGSFAGVAGIAGAAVADALSALRPRGPAAGLGLGGWDQILEEELARRLGVEGRCGVLVIDVEPGGAAERAGLAPLDVVVRAGGARVQSLDDLARRVERAAASGASPLRLAAIRGSALVDLAIAIGPSGEGEGAESPR